ncbi:MAG: hypothetical protein CMG74_13275 [Candidatus Marinimicrobia bacterium]|nr:hypothetical protein [Candidatus Neomarinimicrobiota bacterium]
MSIFPIITITFIAGLTRFITKTWISPGAFFSLCWSFFLIVPIIFAPDYQTDHLALWFITIFTMALAAGSIIAYSNNSNQLDSNCEYFVQNINYKLLFYALLLFCAISSIGLYFLFQYATNKYILNNYYSNWMLIPSMIAIDRYSGVLDYPFLIKYSLYLIYPANLLGGILFGQIKNSRKIKIFSFLPLFLAILLGIIESSRTSILLGLVLFFSAWLSTLMYKWQFMNIHKSFFKIALKSGFFLVVFTVFFILIQWLRQGMDTIIIELMIDRISAYFFGYLAAFSKWLVLDSELNYSSGFITLAGPFNLMGIIDRPLGFYNSIQIANGVSTNIFTAFRGIISDFTIPGAILIAFSIGFFSQTIFQSIIKKTLFRMLPISMFYAFTLYSPLISIFHYNSIFFSWFIILFILVLASYESVDNYS